MMMHADRCRARQRPAFGLDALEHGVGKSNVDAGKFGSELMYREMS
jgi:hypothetical protein